MPTGITNYEPINLDSDAYSHLVTELGRFGFDSPPRTFFYALNEALTSFTAQKIIAQNSTPSITRKSVKSALTAAILLDKRLMELDGNAHRLVNKFSEMSIYEWQERSLSKVISGLEQAQRESDKYPKKGRLPESYRLCLARDVAKAIKNQLNDEDQLNVKPTSTENGLYISVLEIVLKCATGKEPLKVSDLAKRALKVLP